MRQSQADTWTQLLAALSAWRRQPEKIIDCPVCNVSGLQIEDRSIRPYVEWYQLECSACGLTETVQIPLARPMST